MITNEEKQMLITLAKEARSRAYARYSKYQVGAAVKAGSGKIYTGCNVENAAYPDSICAERVAIFKAVSEGERAFEVIAVVTENGGSPCGSCRQVMVEFSQEMLVLIADGKGQLMHEMKVKELLPLAFTPEKLQ